MRTISADVYYGHTGGQSAGVSPYLPSRHSSSQSNVGEDRLQPAVIRVQNCNCFFARPSCHDVEAPLDKRFLNCDQDESVILYEQDTDFLQRKPLDPFNSCRN